MWLVTLSVIFAGSVSILFFPGFMSYDSLYQYSQVIGANQITNDHPPIMVYLWKVLHQVRPSPGTLLIFHQCVYWSAVAILSWAITANRAMQILLLIVVGFWPPLIINSLHLWKDVGMFAAVFLAISALLADWKRPSWVWLVIAALGMFYAYAVRYNAILGLPFISVILAYRIVERFNLSRLRAITIGSVAIVALVACVGVAKRIDGPTGESGVYSIITFDLAALSVAQNTDLFPTYVPRKVDGDFLPKLKDAFVPEVNSSLPPIIGEPSSEHASEFKKYWLSTIMHHLPDYVAHRYHVFSRMMWIDGPEPYYPYQRGINSNDYGIKFKFLDGPLSWDWRATFDIFTHSVVYRPIVYLILSFAIVAYSFFRWVGNYNSFKWFAVTAISCSGLAMTLPLFFLAPAADYRYTIWLITTTIVSLLCSIFLTEQRPVESRNDGIAIGEENA